METTTTPKKQSKNEVHASLKEKIQHAMADFGHMVHEIHFKEIAHNAATFISDALHRKPKDVKSKKTVAKEKPKGHAAKKAITKAAKKTAAKKTAPKKK